MFDPKNHKAIIIGGGVGPMAGVDLHRQIIQNTATDGTDQTHLDIIHLSYSRLIQDRTKYLLNEITGDPANGMLTVAKSAQAALHAIGRVGVMGVPCNTFHAPRIYDRFSHLLHENNIDIKLVHMLAETADHIAAVFPNIKKIGLMSTTGTRRVGVYQDIFQSHGIALIEVDELAQLELHDTIYNKERGIKAVTPVTDWTVGRFTSYALSLVAQGAQAIILGCTEIPLALTGDNIDGVPLINPVTVLARALIREAAPTHLKPLI